MFGTETAVMESDNESTTLSVLPHEFLSFCDAHTEIFNDGRETYSATSRSNDTQFYKISFNSWRVELRGTHIIRLLLRKL
jgi:hypothetical protein